MKRGVFMIILALCLFSCNSIKYEFISQKKIVLKETFPLSVNGYGICFDKELKKDVFFLANYGTLKKINFYDLKSGQRLYSVKLDQFKDWINGIGNIQIINPDSIIVFEKNHIPRFSGIDRNGVKFFETDLLEIQNRMDTTIFEYKLSQNSICVNSESLLLTGMYAGTRNSYNTVSIEQYFSIALYKPYLTKIDNYWNKNSIKINRGLDSFPKKFMNDRKVAPLSTSNYKIISNDLFLWHDFDDHIYIVDTSELKITKEIKINSQYSSIGEPLININKWNEELKNRSVNSGAIISIYFDVKKLLYIVHTRHVLNPNDKVLMQSFILYDMDFKKLVEITVDSNENMGMGRLTYFKNTFYSLITDKNDLSKSILESYVLDK